MLRILSGKPTRLGEVGKLSGGSDDGAEVGRLIDQKAYVFKSEIPFQNGFRI